RTWHVGNATSGFKRKHVIAVTTVNGDLMHTVSTPYGTCRHDDNRSSVWIFRRNEIGGRRQVEFVRWKRNVLVGHIPIGGVGVRVLRRRTSRTGEKRDKAEASAKRRKQQQDDRDNCDGAHHE